MHELLRLYITAASTLVSIMGKKPSYINRQSNYSYHSDNVISVNYLDINTILYPVHYKQTYPAKKRLGVSSSNKTEAHNIQL